MPLFNEPQLRALAKSRSSRAFDSVSDALQKSLKASAALSAFDIFCRTAILTKS